MGGLAEIAVIIVGEATVKLVVVDIDNSNGNDEININGLDYSIRTGVDKSNMLLCVISVIVVTLLIKVR